MAKMTAAQARKHAHKFLGKMLTDPNVLADVKAVRVIGKGKKRGKDPRALGKVMRPCLGMRTAPTPADVQQIAAQMQRTIQTLAAKMRPLAPREAASLLQQFEFYPDDFFNDW